MGGVSDAPDEVAAVDGVHAEEHVGALVPVAQQLLDPQVQRLCATHLSAVQQKASSHHKQRKV